MSFEGAVGRLIQFGEREGGEKLVSAGALLRRKHDRCPIGVFRWRQVVGIALQQKVAAKAVEEGFVVGLPAVLRDRQARVNLRQRAFDFARPNSSSARKP